MAATGHASAVPDCAARYDRLRADYSDAVKRGTAVATDDDAGYCAATKQALAAARARYEWALHSGCLTGSAAQIERTRRAIKALVDGSQGIVARHCR